MGERIETVYGHVDYAAALNVLEAHCVELEEEIGEQNAEATIDAIRDLAAEQAEDANEDDGSGDEDD